MSTPSGPLRVALEVSGLRGGTHEERCFTTFATATLLADVSVDLTTWSVRHLRRADLLGGIEPTLRGWLVSRTSALGLAPRASWAAPRAGVLHLASGPSGLRVDAPSVVTVHAASPRDRGEARASTRRVGELLRRAAGDGAIIHATCVATAEAVAADLGVERASISVALPGVLEVTPRDVHADARAVAVVAGHETERAAAILDGVRAAGVSAELVATTALGDGWRCVVLASPPGGFPFAAIEAAAGGATVVAARDAAAAEVLEGAVTLLEGTVVHEFVDAAVELSTNDAAHAIALAAAQARASDYSITRRGPELVALLRRAASNE